MRKKILILLPVFILLLFISCSKDKEPSNAVQEEQEEVQEETLEPPSVFEILMDEVTFTSATLSWTVPEGTNNENLEYSIFLNDELIVDSQIEQTYVFEDLQNATSYTIKVVAKNEDGETPITLSFETLDTNDFTVLIKRIINPDYPELKSQFGYNENNTLRYYGNLDYSLHYNFHFDHK